MRRTAREIRQAIGRNGDLFRHHAFTIKLPPGWVRSTFDRYQIIEETETAVALATADAYLI
jgi:hypothetical protein